MFKLHQEILNRNKCPACSHNLFLIQYCELDSSLQEFRCKRSLDSSLQEFRCKRSDDKDICSINLTIISHLDARSPYFDKIQVSSLHPNKVPREQVVIYNDTMFWENFSLDAENSIIEFKGKDFITLQDLSNWDSIINKINLLKTFANV